MQRNQDYVELADKEKENLDKVKDFAEAYCDQNSINELKEALTEKDTMPEDKLKKLQAEFFKTHEQLNILAEQINALEKAGKGILTYEEKEELKTRIV